MDGAVQRPVAAAVEPVPDGLAAGSGRPALTPADPPTGTGTPIEPKLIEEEVLYTDREWHPATVLGWYRLHVAHEQLLTGLWVFWLIHLRLESGEDSRFEYAKLNIRPR